MTAVNDQQGTNGEKPSTQYVVMATVGEVPVTVGGESTAPSPWGPLDWPLEMWREVGVLDVPQRTNRTVVVEKAKELVASLFEDGADEPVKVRVLPRVELTEAVVGLEAQPRLVATIVEPGASA